MESPHLDHQKGASQGERARTPMPEQQQSWTGGTRWLRYRGAAAGLKLSHPSYPHPPTILLVFLERWLPTINSLGLYREAVPKTIAVAQAQLLVADCHIKSISSYTFATCTS